MIEVVIIQKYLLFIYTIFESIFLQLEYDHPYSILSFLLKCRSQECLFFNFRIWDPYNNCNCDSLGPVLWVNVR